MNRGRPRQFDEKQALEAAMEVFWSKGFEGASCDELLAAMGINCGSMYAAFGDKQALFDRAFDLYCETRFARAMGILDGPGTPLENVRALVTCWGEFMTQPDCKGCLVTNTVIEFSGREDAVAKRAREIPKRLQAMLEKKLTQAAEAGHLREGATPAALAAFLVNLANGLNVMARAKADKESIQGAVDTAMLLLA